MAALDIATGKRTAEDVAEETISKRPHKTTPKFYIFDIEGTTTPITFVKDVLFPFAAQKVGDFLATTWDSTETQNDVEALWKQAEADDTPDRPNPQELDKTAQIGWLSTYVESLIQKDSKVSALKQLQGHIWSHGYASGELLSQVFEDIEPTFRRLKDSGANIAIYSSGSRLAQRLLFQYSNKGDLRNYLSCYFDTTSGHKREAESYRQILLSLGLEHGSEAVFVTDVLEEAQAAAAAGMESVLSVRAGNAPLPENHGFRELQSFEGL